MTIMARAKLLCRSQQLETMLMNGNSVQIIAAMYEDRTALAFASAMQREGLTLY